MFGVKECYLFIYIYKQAVPCPNKQSFLEPLHVWFEIMLCIYIYKQAVPCPNKERSFESFTCLVRNNAMYLYIYISRLCLVQIKSVLLNLLRVWFEIMLCIYIYISRLCLVQIERSFEPFTCLDRWNMSHSRLFSRAEPNAACIRPS